MTVVYGQVDAAGRLTYCNAGHNPPLIVGRSGVRKLECGGPILGLFPDMPFEEEVIALEAGDWVVVYSDGVSEALSAEGEEFGEARLADVVRAHHDHDPRAMLEAILGRVREFTAGAPQSDDVTALVVKYLG